MGCVASSIDKEERVRVCKERKRLMKQLLAFRKEFADSQLTYLRALKNTGVTLRQFTESETLELDEPAFGHILPPSPPPPLPPSPPPPPNFSPDLRGSLNKHSIMTPKEEIMDINEDDSNTPPPPPVLNTSWEYWDPFGSSSAECEQNVENGEQVEEKWEETKSEFEDEDQEEEVDNMLLPVKQQNVDLVDDNSSTMSWNTKDTADMAMVVWRSKKTLARIVRELDDHFLKVSAGGKDIAVFLDVNVGETFHYHSIKENKSNFLCSIYYLCLAFLLAFMVFDSELSYLHFLCTYSCTFYDEQQIGNPIRRKSLMLLHGTGLLNLFILGKILEDSITRVNPASPELIVLLLRNFMMLSRSSTRK